MATFSRHEIEEGLRRLGELAQAKGLDVRLTLVGGAVMVLRFNARASTQYAFLDLWESLYESN